MRFALLILALATPVAADGLAAIDGEVEKFLEAKAFAGAVTLVEHKGKIVQFKAYGHRDAAAGRPMQKDTIFRIYSMSKPVTSVATLMLVDDGKIKLDDPVAKYIPEFKDLEVWRADDPQPPKRAMTVRDLFCHTSGLVYGWGIGAVDSRYRAERVLDPKGTLKGMVQKLGGIPLAREPGTRWPARAAPRPR